MNSFGNWLFYEYSSRKLFVSGSLICRTFWGPIASLLSSVRHYLGPIFEKSQVYHKIVTTSS